MPGTAAIKEKQKKCSLTQPLNAREKVTADQLVGTIQRELFSALSGLLSGLLISRKDLTGGDLIMLGTRKRKKQQLPGARSKRALITRRGKIIVSIFKHTNFIFWEWPYIYRCTAPAEQNLQ